MPYELQRLFSIAATVLLSPLFLVIAVIILIADGRPIFYRQRRIGLHRRPFTIVKFRTMVVQADNYLGSSGEHGGRLTRSGPLLRRSGLDEIPQLFNVIKGHMALIGPRAVLPAVATNIPASYSSRFDVLPGVTGLAQVSGRHELPWSMRLAYDVEYVEQRSLTLDLRILVRTFGAIVLGTGFSMDRTTHRTDDLGLLLESPSSKEDERS